VRIVGRAKLNCGASAFQARGAAHTAIEDAHRTCDVANLDGADRTTTGLAVERDGLAKELGDARRKWCRHISCLVAKWVLSACLEHDRCVLNAVRVVVHWQ